MAQSHDTAGVKTGAVATAVRFSIVSYWSDRSLCTHFLCILSECNLCIILCSRLELSSERTSITDGNGQHSRVLLVREATVCAPVRRECLCV